MGTIDTSIHSSGRQLPTHAVGPTAGGKDRFPPPVPRRPTPKPYQPRSTVMIERSTDQVGLGTGLDHSLAC